MIIHDDKRFMVNILLLEDNEGFRHLLKELLKESQVPFNLVEVDNPLDGLNQFKKNNYNFDYIISDYFLPIQNGTDFLEVVKSHNQKIRCFLISADESLRNKNIPHVDQFFIKSEVTSLVKLLKTHAFIGN